MLLPALLISDLHLTNDGSDEYRWSIFDWLLQVIKDEGVRTLAILGDLTDAKDYHAAALINRVVTELTKLSKHLDALIVLQGNHDYLKTGEPTFKFLQTIPKLDFIDKPKDSSLDRGAVCLFLPHTKTPAKDWEGMNFDLYDYVFMHQTVTGAKASNGQVMEGEGIPKIKGPKVYSGDIHVPQVIGGVEYVGSPYHVHFGDQFKPRAVLLLAKKPPVDLHFKTIRRLSLKITKFRDLTSTELSKGDQVKVTVTLDRDMLADWPSMRRRISDYMKEQGVELRDLRMTLGRSEAMTTRVKTRERLSDEEIIERFVARNELGIDALEAGRRILK